MPVDQWGNVIFADELTKSGIEQNKDERERKRQGEFANYLQQQGMAPGEGMPQSMGTEFNQFMKAGGLKGYQEEQIAQQQGQSLAGLADTIAKDPEVSDSTRSMGKAHSEAFRSGGIRGPAALEMMKELQHRQMLDQNAKKMQGVEPGIVPLSLDDPRGAIAMDVRTDAQGMQLPHTRPARPGETFNAHVNRATTLFTKNSMGAPLTPEEKVQYNRSVSFMNSVHPLMRTPDMVQIPSGAFPLELDKPGTAQTANPNNRFQSGMLVPQTNDKGTTGQTITRYESDSAGHENYKGAYQVFTPPTAVPLPGQIGPRILAKAPVSEIDKIRDQEFAVNSMRNAADAIDKLNLNDADRLKIYGQTTLGKWLPGTQAIGKLALTPEQEAVATMLRHSQIRYENAMGGVRAAGSPQMYPIFQQLVGNIHDVNAPVKLRELANQLQAASLIGQRDMSQRYEAPTLHFRPERTPGSKAPRAATKPSTSPIAPQSTPANSAGVSGKPMNSRAPLSSFQR